MKAKTGIRRDQLVLDVRDLPTVPSLVADALRVVSDYRSSSLDIEHVVCRDQALAAKVLRVTNSAAYGFRRRVETVREAVVMVGTRRMKDITASMVTAEIFRADATGLVSTRQLWLHALADYLANETGDGPFAWGPSPVLPDGLLAIMQISDEDIETLLEKQKAVKDQTAALSEAM